MRANTTRIARKSTLEAASIAAATLSILAIFAAQANAQMPAIPQLPAALPYADSLEGGEPLPFDGRWRIAENNRKYRVEAGAFIAEHDYVDLFVFKVMADMVVAAEFEPDEEGGYTGLDIGYKIPWSIKPNGKGIRITVQSLFGPVVFNARPLELDDRAAYEAWSRGEPVEVADGSYDEPEESADDAACEFFKRTSEGFVCAE